MRTRLTAHAGCDGTGDNSPRFLRYAMELGVDLVEVDVRQGAEGAFQLAHDKGPAAATLMDALSLLKDHPEKRLKLMENINASKAGRDFRCRTRSRSEA